MTISDLSPSEFHPYYKTYIDKAGDLPLLENIEQSGKVVVALLESITEEKSNHSYAEGKWTIKELLLHIIDAERVFAYRALRIGRRDATPLAGFEQDGYVKASGANHRTFASLIEEYKIVKQATQLLFNNLSEDDLKAMGTASGSGVSARALGFIIIGHEMHHCEILKARYL